MMPRADEGMMNEEQCAQTPSRRILIVEDNSISGELLARMINSGSAGIELVGTLKDAFAHLDGADFDVVLLDLNLPDSGGIDTLKSLHGRYPHVPVLVVTGAYEEALGLVALSAGAQDYLVKGKYDAYILNKSVDYTIERKKTEEELGRARDELEQRVQARTRELTEANRLLESEIAERKRIEAELKISETRLRTVLETVREGITLSDDRGAFYIYNREMEQLTGYTREEASGADFTRLIYRTPEERSRALGGINELNEGCPVRDVEARICTKSGGVKIVLISSCLMYSFGKKMYLSVYRDITKRKESEHALQLSEKRYRGIVEDQTELICRFLKDGTLTFVNEAYCRYFGMKHDELIGKSFLAFIPEEDLKTMGDFIGSLGADKPFSTYEHRTVSSDGDIRWQQWTDRAIFDGRRNIVEYQAVGFDITERKWAEDQLLAARRELEERVEARTRELAVANGDLRSEVAMRTRKEKQLEDSLREKEVLLKEVNHRVKNNLQIISSLLHLQSRYIVDPADLQMFVECQNRIKSMVYIHEKLYRSKDFANIDFGNYIGVLARSLFDSYSISGDRVTLVLTVGEGITFGVDRAIPCGLIVNELVSNSLKYAFPDSARGTIGIDFRRAGDDGYLLKVSDDGVGMPADFDYRNAKSLGLQLVMTLVEQLDGVIRRDGGPGVSYVIEFGGPRKEGKG